MRKIAFALLFAALGSGALAADPLDDQLAKLAEARKTAEESRKTVAAIEESLRQWYAAAGEKLAKAGVIAPGPPPPAPPPTPVDPLKGKVLAAFEADGKPADAAHQLAALYRLAADYAKDPEVKSTSALKTQINTAAADLMKQFPPDASGVRPLRHVRDLVAAEWAAAVGKADDEPITKAERDAAAALFGKLAEILGGV